MGILKNAIVKYLSPEFVRAIETAEGMAKSGTGTDTHRIGEWERHRPLRAHLLPGILMRGVPCGGV